jgi:CheY-like chemotaxis protein
MRDFGLLPPAVLTICLDLQSLPDSQHLSWRDQAVRDLPPTLARRLTWGIDFQNPRPRTRPRWRPGAEDDRLDLGHSGLDITSVHRGADAIKLLRVLRFDLALIGADHIDGDMPPLLEQMRLAAPGIKCAVVSAVMSQSQEQSIREAGVVAVLDAPLSLARLHELASVVAGRARLVAT